MNYGSFDREIFVNQKSIDELYISDEIIDTEEYFSLNDIVRNNGGLLSMPELYNTDMVFYIVRFWGRKIMKILSILHDLSMTVKYINLDDIYISKDGMSLKLRRLNHLSIFDTEGRVIYIDNIHIIIFIFNRS